MVQYSSLFPMTTGTAFYVLMIMGYVVGSVLVAYIAIRAYRHVRQRRDKSIALPRPVYETAQRKSPFAFVRTNRNWHVWKLPVSVPWTRSPAGPLQRKAASTASVKDLSIELLPTTALPPPPTLIPTSPPLVDLSSPSALEASISSRFSISLPPSPRRLPVPLWQQQASSPHLTGHRSIQHPAFPRPPSPHALLATTPPQRQKRSRSLGGVPVRRLSGGASGLRNKVDVELHDFVPGHARGTSEEHLLIDFSSPSDNGVSGRSDDPAPAASNIGVLSPSNLGNKVVGPPVPWVEDEDDLNTVSIDRKSEPDNTAWMWFKSNAPSSIRSYDARLVPRPQVVPFLGGPLTFPLPLPFPQTEKLIDIPSSGDRCLELDSLDSSRTLVEVEPLGKGDQSPPIAPHETSVDVGLAQTVTMDPFSDDYAVDYIPHLSQTQVDVGGHEDQVQESLYPPLVDVDGDESQVRNDQDPSLVDMDDTHAEVSASAGLVFAKSQILSGTNSISPTTSPVPVVCFPKPISSTGGSSQAEQPDWRWVEADDPWSDHVPIIHDETLDPNPPYNAAVDSHSGPVMQDHQGNTGFMGATTSGSLLATVLDGGVADDEVPHLSLDEPGPTEELRQSRFVRGQLDDEDEEDATPRPTPVSIHVQLPVSDDGASLPGIDKTDQVACNIPGNPGYNAEQTIVNDNFGDPDLLPLPEFNLPSTILEVIRTSDILAEDDEPTKFEPRPSSQMPTPPASPPSLSPALFNQRKAGKSLPPSPMTGPKNLSVTGGLPRSRSRSSSPLALQIAPPAVASKENHGDLMQDVSVTSPSLLTAESTKELPSSQAGKYVEEASNESHKQESISSSSSTSSKTTQTVAAHLAENSSPFYPSVRAIVRQPVEIALAMQLRPGLGAGADPAWMVRFLMAMFGWFAVLVSGQENY